MRWFLLSSPILRGGTMSVTEQGIREGVRQVLLPMWNTYYFFTLYANASKYTAKFDLESPDVLDRYLVAKTRDLVLGVQVDLNAFDTFGAAARLRDFADILTNWYVRRSRARFWDGNHHAFDTLYSVLEVFTRVAAPLLPLISEEVFQGLTGLRSVHLTDWPAHEAFHQADRLVEAMDQVRAVSSVANGLRKVNGLRVRLPLQNLTVVTKNADALHEFVDIIAEELNVKSVNLVELSLDSTTEFGVIKRLTVNSRVLGPRVGKQVQQVISASKSGDWSQSGDVVTCGGVELIEGEYEIDLVADLSDSTQSKNLIGILPSGGFVLLDQTVTPELEAEGIARDVIRAVQQARKDADFDVSDRIKSVITSVPEVLEAIETHLELVKAETLTLELETVLGDVEGEGSTVGEDLPIGIVVTKLST
jgi:isoleucyl-tRNA synthetase